MQVSRLLLPFLLAFAVQAQQLVISTFAGGAPPPTPATATQASIGDPSRVALDSSGNLYFGGSHSVFKVDTSGNLTRIAGNGQSGYSGDSGPATSAQLQFPDGIAVDSSGNVYVADTTANVVRLISAQGVISTVAGQGASGYSGDAGPAIQAQLNAPMGLALDPAGNLYIADSGNNVIRKVSKNGVISTTAGDGFSSYGGDGSPATTAALNTPEGVAVDSSGTLYIADTFNNRVRAVASDGVIQTVAGTGISSFSGDNGPPASAALFLPTDVATDAAGNWYIADFGNSRIRKVAQGTIQTVVGGTGTQTIFDEAVATTIQLNGPTGVAVDTSADIYIAEGSIGTGTGLAVGDYRIWKVNAAGVVSTAAGNGIESYSGDGAAATAAQLNNPTAMTFDVNGNLYIADTANHRVRKISPAGVITTAAGTGVAGYSGDGGPASQAQLDSPQGLTADSDGNVYIADTGNNRIRKLQPDGTLLSIAGNGNGSYYGDGGPANAASLHSPHAIWFVSGYYLYIADTGNQRIRELLPDGTIVTVAGNGSQGPGGDGGQATAAQLNLPTGFALDSAGNIYIADQGNDRIRMVSSNGTISTVAGGPSLGLGDSGPATSASLAQPSSVAVDSSGNIYIADTGHNRIREVSNGAIATIAGTNGCCYSGDNGPAASAQLNAPAGLLLDVTGRLYIADSGNNAIRLLQPAPAGPPTITAVENGASNQTGAIAPGEIVTIYGSGLGPTNFSSAASNRLGAPVELNGVVVLFNGVPTQIVYVSAAQVSGIVPTGLTGPTAQVAIQYLGQTGASITVPVAASSPALFTSNSSGAGQVLAINADGTVNGPSNPAAPGSAVTLYLNGVPSQFIAGPLAVVIAGQQAAVSNAAPTSVGVTAVTAQIPLGLPQNNATPISIQVGSIASPAGVTIAIQ